MEERDSTLAAEAQEYRSSGSTIPVDLFARLVHYRSVCIFTQAIRLALICISLALSQTAVYSAKPLIQG